MQVLEAEVPLGHQLAQRLARARHFAPLQVLRQTRLVAQLAHRHGRMQRITLGNLQLLAGQFLIEAGRVDRVSKGRVRWGEESADAWQQLERLLLAVADKGAARLLAS